MVGGSVAQRLHLVILVSALEASQLLERGTANHRHVVLLRVLLINKEAHEHGVNTGVIHKLRVQNNERKRVRTTRGDATQQSEKQMHEENTRGKHKW